MFLRKMITNITNALRDSVFSLSRYSIAAMFGAVYICARMLAVAEKGQQMFSLPAEIKLKEDKPPVASYP